jgi:hypothetical protein
MKSDWMVRWWDLVFVGLIVAAATLLVQYSIDHGGRPMVRDRPLVVEVRVSRPLPGTLEQMAPGDAVLDNRGQKAGRLLSLRFVPAASLEVPGTMGGKQDALLRVLLEGDIPAVRDTPGFSRMPAGLKAGVWCLIATDKAEVSGLIQKVETVERARP